MHKQEDNDDRVPVTCDRNSPGELRKIGIIVVNLPLNKQHHHFLLFQINGGNGAKGAIEHLTLVIVDLLDNPISNL